MKKRNTMLLVLAVVLALFAGAACAEEEEDTNAAGEGVDRLEVTVEAFDQYFKPTTLLVELGQQVEVTLANRGGTNHSFSAPDVDVEIEAAGAQTVVAEFTAPAQPGSFEFFCKYHPDEMQGVISVGGAEEPIQDNDDETTEDTEVETETEVETTDY